MENASFEMFPLYHSLLLNTESSRYRFRLFFTYLFEEQTKEELMIVDMSQYKRGQPLENNSDSRLKVLNEAVLNIEINTV